jgi:ferredoxin
MLYNVTIANRDSATFRVNGHRPLLEQLRHQGVDLPYGCEYGGCITCAAKMTGVKSTNAVRWRLITVKSRTDM